MVPSKLKKGCNYSANQQGGHAGPPLRMNSRDVGADLCVRPGYTNDGAEVRPYILFRYYYVGIS
jgi:hypothetical protein